MPWPRRNPAATAVAGTSIGRTARQIEAESFAPQARAWTSEIFEHIEWRRFEALCEALYGQAGVRTESQSHGADGGWTSGCTCRMRTSR
jgi:restriction system protein